LRKNDVRALLLRRAPSGNRPFQRCSRVHHHVVRPPIVPRQAAPHRTAAQADRAGAAEADYRERVHAAVGHGHPDCLAQRSEQQADVSRAQLASGPGRVNPGPPRNLIRQQVASPPRA